MNNRLTLPADSAIQLIKSHSLPELVEQQLLQMILDGELPSGSKLTEIPLANRLGVSRGPVREALRILEEKRLVRVEKNRGVFVRTITPQEADDIYEVRIPIEQLIMTRLAQTPEMIDQSGLEELLGKSEILAHESDFAGCHACNMEFHDRLAVLTGNAALIDTYRRLVSELSLYRHQGHSQIRDASSLRASVADHRAILAAILAGDAQQATARIVTHIENSRRRTQHYLTAALSTNHSSI